MGDVQRAPGGRRHHQRKLGGHLGKLAAADSVEEEKRFLGRRPQTRYRLTPTGRKALLHHLAALQELVDGERERP